MSTSNVINNFKKVINDMFSPFNTDEPLISEETQKILQKEENRKSFKKIITEPKRGKVTITVEGEEITYFIEA